MVSETSEIVGPIVRALDRIPGVYVLRLNSGRRGRVWMCPAGTPDILAVVHGQAVFFEAKLPGEKPSEVQLFVAAKIARAGGRTYYPTNPGQAVEIVKQLLQEG